MDSAIETCESSNAEQTNLPPPSLRESSFCSPFSYAERIYLYASCAVFNPELLRPGPLPEAELRELVEEVVANNDTGLLKRLLVTRKIDPTFTDKGKSLLRFAADNGQIENLKLLLASGANPNTLDKDGWAPLFGAVVSGNEESVRILLKGGANPDLAGSFGWKPLHAAGAGGKLRSVVQLLNAVKVEGGIDPATVIPPTVLAPGTGSRFRIIPSHLHHPPLPGTPSSRRSRLYSQVILPGLRSMTQISHSVAEYASEIVKYSVSIMSSAASSLHLFPTLPTSPVKALGAPEEIPGATSPSSPDSASSSSFSNSTAISNLIASAKMGADPNAVNNNGQTPLHLSAHQGHFQIVRLLLLYGCDPNIQDAKGRTPLHLVAQRGNLRCAKILLAAGATVHIKDRKGCVPLDRAIRPEMREILEQAARSVPSLVSLCLKRIRLLKLHLPASETLRAGEGTVTADSINSSESVVARVLPYELCCQLVHFGPDAEIENVVSLPRDSQAPTAPAQEEQPDPQALMQRNYQHWWEDRVVWMMDQTATVEAINADPVAEPEQEIQEGAQEGQGVREGHQEEEPHLPEARQEEEDHIVS